MTLHQPVAHEFNPQNEVFEPGAERFETGVGAFDPILGDFVFKEASVHEVKLFGHEDETLDGVVQALERGFDLIEQLVEPFDLLAQNC